MKYIFTLTCLCLLAFASCTKDTVNRKAGGSDTTLLPDTPPLFDFEGKVADVDIFSMTIKRGGNNLYILTLGVTNRNNDSFYIVSTPEASTASNTEWYCLRPVDLDGNHTRTEYTAPAENCKVLLPADVEFIYDFKGAIGISTYNAAGFNCHLSSSSVIVMNIMDAERPAITKAKIVEMAETALNSQFFNPTAFSNKQTAKTFCRLDP